MHKDNNYHTALVPGQALIDNSNDDDGDEHSQSKPSSKCSSLQMREPSHTRNRDNTRCINTNTKTASVSKPILDYHPHHQDVRIVLPRKYPDRLLSENSSMQTTNQACKDVMAKNLSASASLEYKNRLEEMELRIRYMKNDIEFKQGQINSKEEAKVKQQVLQHPLPQNRDKSQAIWRQSGLTSVSHSHSSASSLPPRWSQNCGHERFSSSQSNITRTFDHCISQGRKEVTHLSSSSLSPLSSSSSSSAVEAASSSSLPSPHTSSYRVAAPSTFSVPQSNFQSSSYQATFSSKLYHRNIYTSQQQAKQVYTCTTSGASSLPSSTSTNQTLPVITSNVDAINSHHHIPTSKSVSPYKMVKPKPSTTISTVPTSYFNQNEAGTVSKNYSSLNNTTTAGKISTVVNVFNAPPHTFQSQHLSKALVKKHTPLKVQTAARLVCSKYKFKRLSPASIKSSPRFPTPNDIKTVVQSVPQQMTFPAVTSPSASTSKYKLVKPKNISSSVVDISSLNFKPSMYNDDININQGNAISVPNTVAQGNSGRKRRPSIKSTSRNFQSLKLQRMKTIIPALSSRSLNYVKNVSTFPRLVHSSSYPNVPSSSKSISNQWKKNVFKLDKRGIQSQASSRMSSFKLDKGLVRNNNHYSFLSHSSIKYNRNQRKSLKRETTSNLWNPSTKSNHKNTASLYKWQRHPFNLQPKCSQNQNQSAFKWHRQNSCNTNITRRQVEMARLKQRLKVIMSHRNASISNWTLLTRGSHSHPPHTTSHTPSSSPANGRGGKGTRKEEVNRLVMIGHMLYKASCRKLTRADPGMALTRELSPSVMGSDRNTGLTTSRSICSSSSSSPHSYRQTSVLSPKKRMPGSVIVKSLRPQKMKLVTVRGIRFHVESNGTKLSRVDDRPGHKQGQTSMSRVDIGGMTYVKTGPHTLELSSQGNKILAASRAVHKSLSIVAAKQRKTGCRVKTSRQKHCVFFHRFGKCQRGDQCPFIHDPEKVAVCTRFLRGQCDDSSACPFSHDASVHKMPVCLFYLQGLCSREDCLYLHVKVSPDAPVCNDFLQGFCPLGLKCKKLHSFVCPCYAVFGKCPRRDKCDLLHRHSKKQTDAARVSGAGTGSCKKRLYMRAKNKISAVDKTDDQVCVSEEKTPETKTSLPSSNLLSSSSLSSSSSSFSSPSKSTKMSSSHSSPSSSYLLSSLPSSSSSPSSLNQISSVQLTTSSDSVLKAQPSFISLLSTSSAIPAASSKNHSFSTSSPKSAASLTTYKSPKITPQFSKPKEQDIIPSSNDGVKSSSQGDKKNHVVCDIRTQDFLSLTSVPSTSTFTYSLSSPSSLLFKSSLSKSSPSSSPPEAAAATPKNGAISTLVLSSPLVPSSATSTMAAVFSSPSPLSSASPSISSHTSSIPVMPSCHPSTQVCPRDEKKELTGQPFHQLSNDSTTTDKTPKDYYTQDVLRFDTVVDSSRLISLSNYSRPSTISNNVDFMSSQNDVKQQQHQNNDVRGDSSTLNKNNSKDSLLVFLQEPDISKKASGLISSSLCDDEGSQRSNVLKIQSSTNTSSSVFNKGIIPSFMTQLMKHEKK